PRLPQPREGRVRLEGRRHVAHRGIRVLDGARLPLQLDPRERAHRRAPAQHAVRAVLCAQFRQGMRPGPAGERVQPDAVHSSRDLGRMLHRRSDTHDPVDRHRHLRGELGAVLDADPRDSAHVHRPAPRRSAERPVPKPRSGRRREGARTRADPARARPSLQSSPGTCGRSVRRSGSRSAVITTPGPSRAGRSRPSSRSPWANRCESWPEAGSTSRLAPYSGATTTRGEPRPSDRGVNTGPETASSRRSGAGWSGLGSSGPWRRRRGDCSESCRASSSRGPPTSVNSDTRSTRWAAPPARTRAPTWRRSPSRPRSRALLEPAPEATLLLVRDWRRPPVSGTSTALALRFAEEDLARLVVGGCLVARRNREAALCRSMPVWLTR